MSTVGRAIPNLRTRRSPSPLQLSRTPTSRHASHSRPTQIRNTRISLGGSSTHKHASFCSELYSLNIWRLHRVPCRASGIVSLSTWGSRGCTLLPKGVTTKNHTTNSMLQESVTFSPQRPTQLRTADIAPNRNPQCYLVLPSFVVARSGVWTPTYLAPVNIISPSITTSVGEASTCGLLRDSPIQ